MAHAGRRRAGVDSLTNQSLAAPRRPTDRPTNDQQPGGRSPRNAWMRSVAVSVSVWPDAGEERDERTIEWHKKKFGHLTTRKICRFFDSLQTGKKRKKLQGPCRGEILGPERYIFWNFFFDFFPSQQESGRQLGGGGGGQRGPGASNMGREGRQPSAKKSSRQSVHEKLKYAVLGHTRPRWSKAAGLGRDGALSERAVAAGWKY